MLKDEKKILNSPALDTPDKSVLQDAKAYMPKKKGVNTRLARILAPIACVIVVAVVLGMIPAMIPANSGDPLFVTIDDMVIESILSIEEYNHSHDTALLHFDNPILTKAYYYNEKLVIFEEVYLVDSVKVELLIDISDKSEQLHFNVITEKCGRGLIDGNWESCDNKELFVGLFNGKTYIKFSCEKNIYYLIIHDTDTRVWKNIFSEFCN